jgi:hypothetical protein
MGEALRTGAPAPRLRVIASIGASIGASTGAWIGALVLIGLASGCTEAHVGVALAKRAHDTLGLAQEPDGPISVSATGYAPETRSPAQPAALQWPPAAADEAPMLRDPSLFQAEARTLWDGLPSMGGAWVAHPAAGAAMMVEATNLDTGRSLRLPMLRISERAGRPPIQMSADAALRLGMAPGRLTPVRLIGLRAMPEAPAPRLSGDGARDDRDDGARDDAELAGTAARAAQDAAAAKNDAAAAKSIAAPMARPKAAALAEPTAAQDAAPYVQVAAFGDPANAAETARRFRARDLPAFEMPAGGLRLVLLGPFDTMDAARRARDIAAADGFADAYVAVR